MKILVVTQYPIAASTSNRMLGFAWGLKELGHNVKILVTGSKQVAGSSHIENLPKEYKDIKIIYTPSLPEKFYLMPSYISGILALIFLIIFKLPVYIFHAFKCNVIYSSKSLPYGATLTYLASFITRKPFVLDTDDWEGVGGFATIKQTNRPLVKSAITYYEEKMPFLAKSVVCASWLLAERIIIGGKDKDSVYIARNGADLEKFNPSIDSSEIKNKYNLNNCIVLGYLGSFKDGCANWKMLIDAFKYAKQKHDNIKLFVIGYGYQLADAKKYASDIGHKDDIIFTGRVEHKNVPKYLAAIDICLLPYYDNFPHTYINIGRSSVKLYEYMAMAKAVIATSVGEVKYALENECGILVKTNCAKEFSRSIIELINNPNRIKELSKNARQRAEKEFNYKNLSLIAEKAIKKAIEK